MKQNVSLKKKTQNSYDACIAHNGTHECQGYKAWKKGMRERLTLLALMAVARTRPGRTMKSTIAPSNSGPKNGI